MRILILDTHYQESLRLVYENQPHLSQQPFSEQLQAIYETGFGRADALPLNLNKLGHQAEQFIVNAAPIQIRWASENGLSIQTKRPPIARVQQLMKRSVDRFRPRVRTPGINVPQWEMEVVSAQARAFKPDVIFVCDVLYLPAPFHRTLKEYTTILVGEMAYPIPAGLDLDPFDLIVSAAPHFVDRLRKAGAQSELLRLGFESSILDRLGTRTKDVDVAFIGSVGTDHQRRLELLQELSRNGSLTCWGAGAESLPLDSPLRGRIRPPLWGYDMYRQLQRAKIALNIHIDMAEQFAANMRLYEATGVGTMLLTDWKTNLHQLFRPGKEVATYRSPQECLDRIAYYLEHEDEREAMAKAGQQRTLCDHTYYHRMQELIEILNRYLAKNATL